MKNIFYLFTLVLSLSSCIKYAEPTSLSLSGEYVIDKITYSEDENTTSPNDSTYYPGDLYINPNDKFPVDSIHVGFTKWHLDYSVISFSLFLYHQVKCTGVNNISIMLLLIIQCMI